MGMYPLCLIKSMFPIFGFVFHFCTIPSWMNNYNGKVCLMLIHPYPIKSCIYPDSLLIHNPAKAGSFRTHKSQFFWFQIHRNTSNSLPHSIVHEERGTTQTLKCWYFYESRISAWEVWVRMLGLLACSGSMIHHYLFQAP